ncbi:Uncharacterised protein [Mycobacteroides abscessus]|nr:Uncharacterised protein [Mycobacteroides abscessus]
MSPSRAPSASGRYAWSTIPASRSCRSSCARISRKTAVVSARSLYSSMSRLRKTPWSRAAWYSGSSRSTTRAHDPSRSHVTSCDATDDTLTDT